MATGAGAPPPPGVSWVAEYALMNQMDAVVGCSFAPPICCRSEEEVEDDEDDDEEEREGGRGEEEEENKTK